MSNSTANLVSLAPLSGQSIGVTTAAGMGLIPITSVSASSSSSSSSSSSESASISNALVGTTMSNGGGGGGITSAAMGGGATIAGNTGSTARMPPRAESLAYPRHANQRNVLRKVQFMIRHNTRPVTATIAFVAFLLILSSDMIHDARGSSSSSLRGSFYSSRDNRYGLALGGAHNAGYFHANHVGDAVTGFHFAAVTDLDQLSKVDNGGNAWYSVLLPGLLKRNTGSSGLYTYTIELLPSDARNLITKHNEGGRGAEFSELTIFQNRLLTFDDRTGDVFEILNTDDGKDTYAVPRLVITEGMGDTDKGMKWEWATVKDGDLYMGSMGKEYTKPDGTIVNTNNLWIAILDGRTGQLRRENWYHVYQTVRHALDAESPGYIIIEAMNWSSVLRKWIFLPRRISRDPYDDVADEKRGGNRLVMVNEAMTQVEVVEIKFTDDMRDQLRGFSSFAFVPGTQDRHAMAIRSVEENCAGDDLTVCKQRSYFTVFDVMTGEILAREVQAHKPLKFEGLEFVDIIHTKPPPSSS